MRMSEAASEQEIVGFLTGDSPDALTAMLGILESGSAFLPLDPRLPAGRLAFMMEDCGVRIVVTGRRFQALVEELSLRCPHPVDVIYLEDIADDAEPAPAPEPVPDPDRLCYVIYTSGSTGVPKGVGVTHRNLGPMLTWGADTFGMGPGTRSLHSLNHAFDFGAWALLATVCAGGTTCFAGDPTDDPTVAGTDPQRHAELVREHRIDTLHTTPTFFTELAASGVPLTDLRIVHLGGEELTGGFLAETLPLLSPECAVFNGYGPTETTVNCALYRVDRSVDWAGQRRVPIGRPSAGNLLYVVNERLEAVPAGVAGELVIGGAGVAPGYLGRPEITRERFVPNPFAPGTVYRSGDRMRRRPDGNLEFLGRLDGQVKLRGYRVEPGEAEQALLACPGVTAAAVVVREDSAVLAGYLVLEKDLPLDEVRELLRDRLPAYLVPATLTVLAALPRTPNGKLDRAALPAPAATAPAEGVIADGATPAAPAEGALGATAVTVGGIWSEVLGVPDVTAETNFFEAGGHSLLAFRILSNIRRKLAVDVPAKALFDTPRFDEFTAQVEALVAERT